MSSTSNLSPNAMHKPGFRLQLRHVQFALSILALGITGYMTYNKLAGIPLPCTNTGLVNCSVVEASAWARVGGIPTALLGFISHLAILSVLFLETRQRFFKDNGVLLLFGLTIFGALYHGYLIYVSIAILKALCPFCLAAAAIMFLQFGIMIVRLRRSLTT